MRSLPEILEEASRALRVLEERLKEEREPIRIWPFKDAPEELKALSDNGGDEDWLAFVPQWIVDEYGEWIPFLDIGSSFGTSHVARYPVPGGVILIGCHA